MKEYLSMADWFDGSVFAIGSNLYSHCENIDSSLVAEFHCNQDAKYASHAISSHDELVAEVARLRKSLKWAVANLQFEYAYEWSDEENADAHYSALKLLGVQVEE